MKIVVKTKPLSHLGTSRTSWLIDFRKVLTSERIFSSARNLMLGHISKWNIFACFDYFCRIVQGSLDMFLSKFRISFQNILHRFSRLQHLQDQINQDSSPFKAGLSMANVRYGYNQVSSSFHRI